MEEKITFSQYMRMRERTHDYAIALSRTNLVVQLLKRRKKLTHQDDINFIEWMWILDNHIVQAFYHRYGIDIQYITIDSMYGYARKVGIHSPICMRTDLIDGLSVIATGSSRVDSHERISFYPRDELEKGIGLLQVVDRAALFAVGGQWPGRCLASGCWHHKDAGIYQTIFQILTLMVVMGWFDGHQPILGTWVDCSPYGDIADKTEHPLRKLGLVFEPCFAPTWFDCQSLWINRHDGTLVLQQKCTAVVEQYTFNEWYGGSVEHGLQWLISKMKC